ncbi:uncharacterized protein [Drosophila bipectinata]|uniref:uncharacterized protein n=1 Tax=Drosophila bipectinata TaxID=42026 RepID=UPI001C8AAC14|nr:uncharacterized protein LOC108133418 [Drosophila bipectinata]
MGKDPSAVVLAAALAFCAFCPFFARCDEIELDIKKGLASLSNVLVKYQAEFDRKVKFVELQKAIDEIDTAMLEYNGTAKDKLSLISSLNFQARLIYQNCVSPVFDSCQTINGTFDIFIDNIGDSNLSETNRNIIWNLTVSTLELGLTETEKSLECLTYFQNRIEELDNAIQNISIYVRDDFGPGGFYGEVKAKLEKGTATGPLDRHLTAIFIVLTKIFNLKQKQTYEAQMELIERFFTFLTQKIENATEIVKDMESDLEEDKSNLHRLRGDIFNADMKKGILLSDIDLLRRQFIPDIKNLQDICAKYVNWHGYNAPFYQKNRSRTRRAASTFYESESSPA